MRMTTRLNNLFNLRLIAAAVLPLIGCRDTGKPLEGPRAGTVDGFVAGNWSETNRPSLEQKVAQARLIVVGKIKGSWGSRLQNTVLKDERVLWGEPPQGKTLVLLIRETRFRYTHGNDTEWIFFVDGSSKE